MAISGMAARNQRAWRRHGESGGVKRSAVAASQRQRLQHAWRQNGKRRKRRLSWRKQRIKMAANGDEKKKHQAVAKIAAKQRSAGSQQ